MAQVKICFVTAEVLCQLDPEQEPFIYLLFF